MDDGSCPVCYKDKELVNGWECIHQICSMCLDQLYICPMCRDPNRLVPKSKSKFKGWYDHLRGLQVDMRDVELVRGQIHADYQTIIQALIDNNLNIVDTIIALSSD